MVIFVMTLLLVRMFFKFHEKAEENARYRNTLSQLREVMRFAQGRDLVPHQDEADGDLLDENMEEEYNTSPDEEISDREERASTSRDVEGSGLRRRVIRREGQHFAANGEDPDLPGDEPHGGDGEEPHHAEEPHPAEDDEEEESFEV